jgi:hypothetical protein
MENDLIFATETSDLILGAAPGDTQIAAAPMAAAPVEGALAVPLDAAQVVIPEGATVVRVPVTPGEVIELPFPPDAHFLAELGNGNLGIKVGDVTVILQGYVDATGQNPPVIEASNGQPLDIATIIASTDPAIDIQTAAGPAAGPQGGTGNTGAIFAEFGGAGGLGGFTGVGAQDGTDGLGGGTVVPTGTLLIPFGIAAVNLAPSALDEKATTNEDTAVTGQVIATDPEGDALTYSTVGATPLGLTFNPDGSWTFDPTVKGYDALNVGGKDTVTFQYVANDGTSDSNVGTVTIDITGVDDAPSVFSSYLGQSVFENDPLTTTTINWSITDVDDTAFTIDVDKSTLPPGVSYDPTTNKISVDPNGNYDYLAAGEKETFIITFIVTDAHGASTTHDVFLNVKGQNDAVDAVNDAVLTNVGANGAFTIPEWALLANDADRSAEDVTGVGTVVGGAVAHSGGVGTDGTVTFTDDAALNGSFKYDETDGSSATVTVTNQAPGNLNGTAAHEIIVSGDNGDKIDGQGGRDLIFGGGGDDTVIFHNGDVVQGGSDSIASSNALATAATRGDVLALDHTVNFNNLSLTHSDGIETISTAAADGGTGAQNLTIGAATVTGFSDHTITPGGVFVEHEAIRVDGDAVDQLYLSISKDPVAGGGWADTGVDVNGYHVFAHETTAGNAATADAYVMVQAANVANVHLNQDAP